MTVIIMIINYPIPKPTSNTFTVMYLFQHPSRAGFLFNLLPVPKFIQYIQYSFIIQIHLFVQINPNHSQSSNVEIFLANFCLFFNKNQISHYIVGTNQLSLMLATIQHNHTFTNIKISISTF